MINRALGVFKCGVVNIYFPKIKIFRINILNTLMLMTKKRSFYQNLYSKRYRRLREKRVVLVKSLS